MKFLVTGATGFIGRALAELLLGDCHDLLILTRDGRKAEHMFSHPNVDVLSFGSTTSRDLLQTLKGFRGSVDGVFHLAANQKYLGKRSLLFRDNVGFSKILLQWANERHADFFVYTSSIDAMGPTHDIKEPLHEERPCRPLSTYGWSKLQAERLVSDYGKKTNLRTVSLRLGNVYGPGSDFIILDIAKAICEGPSNPISKYYWQIKNCFVHLCYVDDVARGIYQSAFANFKSGDVFLLSGEEPTTIKTLVDYISEALNFQYRLPRYNPVLELSVRIRNAYLLLIKRKADRVTYFKLGHWLAETEKARQILGFRPEVSCKDGIARTLTWGLEYEKQRDTKNLFTQYA